MHKLPNTTGPFCGKSWDIRDCRLRRARIKEADVDDVVGVSFGGQMLKHDDRWRGPMGTTALTEKRTFNRLRKKGWQSRPLASLSPFSSPRRQSFWEVTFQNPVVFDRPRAL